MLGLALGSIIGGYIPTIWGASGLSFISLLGSTFGGAIGVYLGYKITNN